MATLVCNNEIIEVGEGIFECSSVSYISTDFVIDPVVATSVFGAGFTLFAVPFLIGYSIIVVVNFVRGIE